MKDKFIDHGEISGFLDEGTSFVGELTFRNTMRIDGKFKGTIKSKNVLIVGETAEIDGDLEVTNVSINGKVSGNIIADKKIEIHSKGNVLADLTTPKLVIEDGALFQGKCSMNNDASPKPIAENKELPGRNEPLPHTKGSIK
jgi:cytoskeletal protein CcmA (bactofilin family)